MTAHEARRSAGTRDASAPGSTSNPGAPDGYTVAVAWKLTVAGGMGSRSARTPPRRTGTVTATRPLAAMWRAFQLSRATATYSRRPTTAYTTPLDRGAPFGVTWLITANDAAASWRQTHSLVRRGAGAPPAAPGGS